ncbi:MAG: hypothetical protein K0S41_4365 [Anaerocolumna sp.]|jgi:hypothetical protein|nr:hypothetical protein [Anaerocolumna sp.]
MGKKVKKQDVKSTANRRMEVVHKKNGIEKMVHFYNFIGTIVGFWVLLYPNPYKIVITISIIVALMGFIIMFIFNKSVEFITQDKSRPSVGAPVILNSAAIWGIAIFHSNTIYSYLFWTYFIICFAPLVLLMAVLKKINYKNIPFLIFILLSITSFSMGTITIINHLYDNTTPAIYYTSIVKKNIYESGSKYHVKLHEIWVLPRGPLERKTKVVVSQEFYDAVYDDQRVELCIQSGLLGIKWYYLQF